MDAFAAGRGIRAADLNRLASDAASKGIAGSAYLAHSNGFELVQRNPRRGHTAPRGRGAGGAAGDPHLVLRIHRLSPAPLVPNGAWTLDGAAVAHVSRILAIASNLAMPEYDEDATIDTFCIGHRVFGFSADIGEGA